MFVLRDPGTGAAGSRFLCAPFQESPAPLAISALVVPGQVGVKERWEVVVARRAEVEGKARLWRELQELGILGSAETWSGSLRGFPSGAQLALSFLKSAQRPGLICRNHKEV